MSIKAVQQIMLGTVMRSELEARQTLAAVKAAGYEGIELNGFMMRKTSLLVRLLTKAAGMPVGSGGKLDWQLLIAESGLQVVSIHEDLGTIKRDLEAVTRQAQVMGTKYVVITGMYRFDYSDCAAVTDLAEQLNRAGKALKAGGISLLYHNHNCELRRVAPGMTAYQLLMAETDPAHVGFEFDSYWPTEAGADALAMMKALGNRMKLYHINDRGKRVTGATMTPILKADSMELGDGNMPLDALVAQAIAAPVDAIILESHRNWVDKSPIKSLERSAAYLNGVHLS